MIDLHCHILPELDDGARDLADSVAMARQAAEDGIEAVCATPHIRHDHDVVIGEISERVDELNNELSAQGLPVRILSGGEVAETVAEGLTDDELRTVSLAGAGWILLEPGPGPLSGSLEACVGQLARRGHRCIIAHPERHLAADMLQRLARLVRAGALIQATADPLCREETAEGMLDLARHGLIHVLGSDAHSSRFGRPVHLSNPLQRLREIEWLRPHVEWIAFEAPRSVVSGRPLEIPFAPAADL